MQNANQGHAAGLNGKGLHIGIVQARFNEDITNTLAQACKAELAALGVGAEHIHHVKTCLRPWHARPTRVGTQPAWPWKWPS